MLFSQIRGKKKKKTPGNIIAKTGEMAQHLLINTGPQLHPMFINAAEEKNILKVRVRRGVLMSAPSSDISNLIFSEYLISQNIMTVEPPLFQAFPPIFLVSFFLPDSALSIFILFFSSVLLKSKAR